MRRVTRMIGMMALVSLSLLALSVVNTSNQSVPKPNLAKKSQSPPNGIVKKNTVLNVVDLLVPRGQCSDLSFCENAHADCYWKKQVQYKSCKLLGGGTIECYQDAQSIYLGCMVAWGCQDFSPI